MSSSHPVLHPHSTTHAANGSVLPALRTAHSSSGGGGALSDPLCFDVRELQGKQSFDAHAFVTKCLHSTNPAFASSADSGDAAASSQAAALLQMESEGLSLPAHVSPPSLPLELLRDHLTRYQLFVKSELVELLNLEYARFIGLASSLEGLDRSIQLIQTHLQQLAKEVETIQARLGSSALDPVDRLLSAYQVEQNKQSYLHIIQFVLSETKNISTAIKDNEEARNSEEEEKASHRQSQEEGVSPAHARLIAHHLSASHARQQQRASDLKQQRRVQDARGLGRSKRDASGQVQPAYADLKLDIPPWMMQQYSGAGAAAAADSDAEDDADDADAAEEAEDANDAFGLYEALLKVPSQQTNAAASSTTAQLDSLRARLVRVERSSVSLSIVRALLPLCAHFQLVRDLSHADGVSGPFDQLQSKLQAQAREVLRSLLGLVLSEYEQQTVAGSADAAATIFPPSLLSLLRMSLRSLTFLDLRSDAEELVRTALVKPILQSLVQAALPKLRAANALDESAYWSQHDHSDAQPMRILYKQLLQFMRGPVQLVIQACCQADSNDVLTVSSLRSSAAVADPAASAAPLASGSRILPFSFLASSFFSEVVSYLSAELGSVLFGSGLPHVFLAHYRATQWMLREVESFALQVDGSVHSLHAHPSWAAFDKRWNVGIYFQLRFNTIAATFEQAVQKTAAGHGQGLLAEYLSDAASSSSSNSPAAFHLPVSRAVWTALDSCFSRHIFLEELAPRFMRLALQCLARYAKMAEELIASNSPQSAAAASSNAASSAAGPSAASNPLPNAEVLFLLLASDADRLRERISAEQLPLIVKIVNPAGDAKADSAVRNALTPSFDRLASLSASAQTSLLSLMLSRCTPSLSYVSRIKPAYRFSRQPVHALQYVRGMLQPLVRLVLATDAGDLRSLLTPGSGAQHGGVVGGEMDVNEGMADDAHDQDAFPASVPPAAAAARVYSASARASLLRGVVGQLSSLYAEEATKCLSGDIFGELSKKLNKKTNAAAAAGSEVDKTRRQMQLDAALFARIAKEQLRTPDADELLRPLLQATQVPA